MTTFVHGVGVQFAEGINCLVRYSRYHGRSQHFSHKSLWLLGLLGCNCLMFNLLSHRLLLCSCTGVWFSLGWGWLGMRWVSYITAAAKFKEEKGKRKKVGGGVVLFIHSALMLSRKSWLQPFWLRESICLTASTGEQRHKEISQLKYKLLKEKKRKKKPALYKEFVDKSISTLERFSQVELHHLCSACG